jgi:phosphoribosylaminoimidazole (AIR) synthetase
MYKTFNCGIGLILSASPKEAIRVLRQIKNFKADIIREVISGNGKVKIQSVFSNKEIVF